MRAHQGTVALALCLGLFISACTDQGPESPGSPVEPSAAPLIADPEVPLYSVGESRHGRPMHGFEQPCRRPEHRQFDFWLGKWNVFGAAGSQIATSIISRDMGGCLIMEDFIQNNGFQGLSMSAFDRKEGRWHQTFVDNIVAASFRLAGGLQGRDMVMSGSQDVFSFATGTVRHRDVTVTWSTLPQNRVRQVFVASFDGGPPATTFNGLYVPERNLDRAATSNFGLCQGPISQFLQLDFWIGSWRVTTERGHRLGSSQVRKDLNDCLIVEDFRSREGYRSRSFVYFDIVPEKWFRSFADTEGRFVELSGEQVGDGVVITGKETNRHGRELDLRVTIRPDGVGRVLQTVEVSRDGGTTWKKDFTLVYLRK